MAGLLERLGLEIGPPRIQPPVQTPYNIDLPGMLARKEQEPVAPVMPAFTAPNMLSDVELNDMLTNFNAPVSGMVGDIPSAEVGPADPAGFLEEVIPKSYKREPLPEDTPQVAAQKAVQNQGSAAIVQSGGGDAELSAWDKLNQEFDMGVVGMALLASNDGSGNVGANLGKALMMGKQARMSQDDTGLEKQRNALKDSLEVRKTRVQEENAKTMRISAYAKGTPKQVRSLPSTTQQDMFKVFADSKIANAPGVFSPDISDEELNRWYLIANDALKFAEKDPSMAGVPTEQILEQAWTAQRTPGFLGGSFTFGATK